jgi:hypothetical protein
MLRFRIIPLEERVVLDAEIGEQLQSIDSFGLGQENDSSDSTSAVDQVALGIDSQIEEGSSEPFIVDFLENVDKLMDSLNSIPEMRFLTTVSLESLFSVMGVELSSLNSIQALETIDLDEISSVTGFVIPNDVSLEFMEGIDSLIASVSQIPELERLGVINLNDSFSFLELEISEVTLLEFLGFISPVLDFISDNSLNIDDTESYLSSAVAQGEDFAIPDLRLSVPSDVINSYFESNLEGIDVALSPGFSLNGLTDPEEIENFMRGKMHVEVTIR